MMTVAQINLLSETIQQLSLARNIDAITEIVRKSARKLTGADGATFVLRDHDLCYYADEDAIEPLWKGQRFPINTCVSGWAMLNRKPAIIEDIYLDDRIPLDAYKPTFVKSLAMVPIRKMKPIGAIGNYWGTLHAPTEEEVQLLQALADITSVSIENVYAHNELENRVKQRTQELEFANKELETFSYSVSHDLRSPLNSINALIQLLAGSNLDKFDEQEKYILNAISTSTVKMRNLIDDLLAFSKLGKKEIEKINVDMDELTRDVISNLDKSKVDLTEIHINKLPSIKADYNLMYQVIFNLISNAIKYSSKKEHPKIEISSSEQDGQLIFSVKDNGAGFDMKYAEKLFNPFQRLHSQSEFEGTGVGLAIVQRIVYKHGGNIWAEAEVGVGATFYFSIQNESVENQNKDLVLELV